MSRDLFQRRWAFLPAPLTLPRSPSIIKAMTKYDFIRIIKVKPGKVDPDDVSFLAEALKENEIDFISFLTWAKENFEEIRSTLGLSSSWPSPKTLARKDVIRLYMSNQEPEEKPTKIIERTPNIRPFVYSLVLTALRQRNLRALRQIINREDIPKLEWETAINILAPQANIDPKEALKEAGLC